MVARNCASTKGIMGLHNFEVTRLGYELWPEPNGDKWLP